MTSFAPPTCFTAAPDRSARRRDQSLKELVTNALESYLMATLRLSPAPVKIVEHVGDTCTINVNAVQNGAAVNLTAWTITAAVYTKAGGTSLQSFAVIGTTTRVLTLTAAQTTTLGAGRHWYEVKGIDGSAKTFTFAHGIFALEY